MTKKIAIFFLGDYRFDGRCCNMIQTLTKNHHVTIYHNEDMGFPMLNQNKNLNVINIILLKVKWIKYFLWFLSIYKKDISHYDKIIASDLYSLFPYGSSGDCVGNIGYIYSFNYHLLFFF